MKKRTLLFLSLCASALNAQLVQADMVNAPSSQVSSSQVAETGGQLSVVDEAGQIKAILSNIQGEIIGVTAQFSSETNSGITVTFSMDEQGRYVAVLDRSAFAEEDQVFSLELTAQLTDGSFQTLSDYSFEWKKDVVSAAEKPTALNNSNAISSKIEEEAISTTTSSTVNSSLTAGTTSSTSNSLTRSSSNTIAGSSNGSTSVPSARVSTASSSVNVTQPTGIITIENRNDAQGTFDIRVTNVSSPRGLDKVYVPTWTESGGQDDIVWHEASRQSDGSYLARINKNQHKYESGKYISHVYYRGHDGSMTAIGGASVELPELKSTGTITIENRNDAQGTFDVRVTNVSSPRGLDKVYVPTWTESGGQDDIVWHEASRQSDGSYLARINKNQHKYESGKYISHVYYRGHDGSMTAIGGASVELPELKSTGTITIENRNDAQGTFDVRVTNVSSPRGLDKVYVPTWTESGGQDDIVWHEASRQSDGSYLARINKTQHKYESGKYISHVYYRGHDGSMTAIGGASVELPELKLSGTITVSDVNVQAGSFKVRITNISSPRGLDKVYVPTWTESGGQDDIVWHEASRQSDGSYLARINKTQHKYSSGKYISHVYYRGTDGSMTAVGGTSVELPSTRSYTVYIDPGHGGRDSGASYGGVHEKNLALSVSNKLRENLLKYGINVLMTRTGDYDVDFKTERSRMTNASNADLFISIHFNATGAGVSNATGIETYWYQYDPEYQPKINKEMHNNPTRLAESEILANKVQESLIKETGAVNRGVRRETFAVLRETAIPAILVELGFMDNPSELQVIKQDSYHTRLAKALAQGVMNWYGAVEGK
ncbi:GBS Bsp-like repeat-containing protein [Streptococcus suis]|uniref:GBS Bsp-like repeat-containing protein n=1 Tax=Streptococcus suis TaxID=1307 RepID=UPI00209B5CF5|nr:GBS Bsp-like repeat-containing protein [Streptococcus suis]MCO8202502.1 GBS Bsp-like repeat-containing protein [Streptococcus suis]MCO8221510.1 GBS Bsp-like repeat-containing protein [Streptococcus suis]MCO8227811.1 GBS Bsp-like repeat-containing protein [Streptococcus suis]